MQFARSQSSAGLSRLFGSEQNRALLGIIGMFFLLLVGVVILVALVMRLFRVFTREGEVCPRCHGNDTRRSHYRSGPADWILARCGCAAMRCRNCHGRFYARCEDVTPMRHRTRKVSEP